MLHLCITFNNTLKKHDVMKRLLTTILSLSFALAGYACGTADNSTAPEGNSTTIENSQYTHPQCPARYVMYPTENIWNFLELDTRTGRVWQVQFVINGDNRFKSRIVSSCLDWEESEADAPDGRFALYPTQNIYTFLLVDQRDGDVWQVQWTTDDESLSGIVAEIKEYGF